MFEDEGGEDEIEEIDRSLSCLDASINMHLEKKTKRKDELTS